MLRRPAVRYYRAGGNICLISYLRERLMSYTIDITCCVQLNHLFKDPWVAVTTGFRLLLWTLVNVNITNNWRKLSSAAISEQEDVQNIS